MMSREPSSTAAKRLARHREEMDVALHEGISLSEARLKLAKLRLERTISRCGRVARDVTVVRQPAPQPEPVQQPRFWWEDQ